MDHIQSFDSMDAMFAAMAASEDAANRNLTPGQIALRDDVENTRYWARALIEDDLVIYGIADPVNETQADAYYDVAVSRERGYLAGTAYSAWEPEGEVGDTHVSQVIPIDPTTFRLAKILNWPVYSTLRTPENHDLVVRLARAEKMSKR